MTAGCCNFRKLNDFFLITLRTGFLECIILLHCVCYLRRWIWCLSWLLLSAFRAALQDTSPVLGETRCWLSQDKLASKIYLLTWKWRCCFNNAASGEWRCWPEQGLCSILHSRSVQGHSPRMRSSAGAIPHKTQSLSILSLDICILWEHANYSVLVPEVLMDQWWLTICMCKALCLEKSARN